MKELIVLVLIVGYVTAESCIQCNSNGNPQCATSPSQFMSKSCSVQNSTCYTRILSGLTIRGCSSDLNSTVIQYCSMNGTCQTCNQTGCNNMIFPQNRPTCYQCDSRITPNCSQSSYALPLPCPIYAPTNRCYIFKTVNSFKRGCLSTNDNTCSNITQCYVCSGYGCNDMAGNSSLIPTGNDATWRAVSSSLLFFAIAVILFKLN